MEYKRKKIFRIYIFIIIMFCFYCTPNNLEVGCKDENALNYNSGDNIVHDASKCMYDNPNTNNCQKTLLPCTVRRDTNGFTINMPVDSSLCICDTFKIKMTIDEGLQCLWGPEYLVSCTECLEPEIKIFSDSGSFLKFNLTVTDSVHQSSAMDSTLLRVFECY